MKAEIERFIAARKELEAAHRALCEKMKEVLSSVLPYPIKVAALGDWDESNIICHEGFEVYPEYPIEAGEVLLKEALREALKEMGYSLGWGGLPIVFLGRIRVTKEQAAMIKKKILGGDEDVQEVAEGVQ